MQNFVIDIQQFKKIRLLGSAALSLAYVACGRVDYYYEKYQNLGCSRWFGFDKIRRGVVHFTKPKNDMTLTVQA